jgi:hypothetical protein
MAALDPQAQYALSRVRQFDEANESSMSRQRNLAGAAGEHQVQAFTEDPYHLVDFRLGDAERWHETQ